MKNNEWDVRNYLATERTDLAIDRTLLSYIRTSMTVIVVGISLIKLFQESYFHIVGTLMILLALLIMVIGIFRTKRQKKRLKTGF